MEKRDTTIDLARRRIEKADISEENKNILRDYMISCNIGENMKKKATKTINSEILHLCSFAQYQNKFLKQVDKEDIKRYVFYITNEKNLAQSTIMLYSILLKQFYSWLDNGFHEHKVDWIKGGKTRKRNLDQTKLLSPTEILSMVKIADRFRDKAMVMGLYESACRISEFMGIQLKDIQFDSAGCIIRVSGKTGQRNIRLIDSAPYFLKWLEEHPYKDDPERYLFINFATNFYGNQLNDRTLRKKMKTFAKRAGIKKNVFPHLLRHSRLTWLAQNENFNEAHLKIFAGWSPTSDMAHIYTHINENDVDRKLRMARGLIDNKESIAQKEQKKALNFRDCPRCEKRHTADTLYCNCGMCLDPKEGMKIDTLKQEAITQAVTELMNIMQDPRRRHEFEKFKKKEDNQLLEIDSPLNTNNGLVNLS